MVDRRAAGVLPRGQAARCAAGEVEEGGPVHAVHRVQYFWRQAFGKAGWALCREMGWFVESGKLFPRTEKHSGNSKGWPVRKLFKVLAR